VIFTIDPNTNYKGVIHITSSYGLGESIVGGEVDADEFYIDKNYLNTNLDPIIKTNCGLKQIKYVLDEYGVKAVSSNEAKLSINSEEVIKLAKIALKMEEYFAHPVDIEWAKDGITNEIMIVQSRPIVKKIEKLANSYKLLEKADVLLTGISIGNKIGCGKIKIMHDYNDLSGFNENDILVTDSTDPNWEPLMRKASALITNKGSRTCHAAIIAREIGIPAILGTKTATSLLNTNQEVTLECSLGAKGYVYDGVLNYKKDELVVPKTPTANVNWLLNIGDRASSFYWSELPVSGIGLLRMEFVINKIGIHPMSLFNYSKLNKATKNKISEIITDEDSIKEAYIKLVSKELLSIISPFKHKKITIRLSDLKSNEYRSLLGGDIFEPNEENPMLGFRGAARYLDKEFHESFLVELEILKRLQEYNINFDILVPFVRNIDEGKKVVSLLSNHGFNKHNVYMMCELPINVLLIEDFLKVFDGVSIGTNDLMQLTYGVDRDSSISDNYNANDKVLRMMIKNIITACENNDKYVSICGQEPSDNPDFTIWLIKNGMKNISLNPDSLYSIFSKVNEKQT
jgi:pyruvate,water dikinase